MLMVEGIASYLKSYSHLKSCLRCEEPHLEPVLVEKCHITGKKNQASKHIFLKSIFWVLVQTWHNRI